MRPTLLAGAAALFAASSAQAQQSEALARKTSPVGVSFSTGMDYSKGDYGLGADTDILVVPFSVRATAGDFAFSGTLPYLKIDGPGGVVVGPDGQPLPGVAGIPGKRSGMGDLSLGATYTFRPSGNGLEVGFGGRVKLPISDETKHLGTGKADVKVSADVSYAMEGFIPFVNVGYRFLGDPGAVELRDGPTASVGFSAPVGRNVIILSYDYATATTRLSKDSHELFGGLSVPLNDRFTVTGYGVGGLSTGSPDFGVGILLTVKIL
jgi:hypothetical protein